MNHQSAFPFRPLAATALACALATPAQAVTYTLVATSFPATMPDGTSGVPMWGYRVSAPNGDLASAQAAPVTSPGAALVVPPGDSTLSVTLVNELRDGTPTSFVVHGLNTAMTPVFADAAGAPCTPATAALPANATPAQEAARRACRFRSFTAEALAGGAAVTYTYNNVRPGTYLYQSGTMPQVQVQMGLYGMMSKDAAAGTVYPGVTYAGQTRVIFSEVDSALHDAVTAQTFSGSTLDYNPNHYRTHVYDPLTHLPLQVAPGAAPQAMGAGQSHLIRIANAGLQTRVPTLSDGTWALLGEDAQPYPYAREQYSALLPAAKTTEAWLGSGRALTLFDRRLGFADAAAGVAGQFVQFAAASTTPTQLSAACPTTGTQGVAWTCSVSSSTPGATLSLVSGPAGMSMTAGGAMNWTPSNEQAQRPANPTVTNSVQVMASAPGYGASTSSFSVVVGNVNDAPTAVANTYAVAGSAMTVPAATGVLANDSDIDGDTLSAALVAAPANGTLSLLADGSFTYSLPAGTALPTSRSFTYRADDPAGLGTNALVTLNFSAVPPVAVADSFTFNNTLLRPTQTFVILGNDVPGSLPFNLTNIQVAREATGTGATTGSLTVNLTRGEVNTPAAGTITYRAPLDTLIAPGQAGTDYFYYRVRDTAGTFSAWTRVDVTMN